MCNFCTHQDGYSSSCSYKKPACKECLSLTFWANNIGVICDTTIDQEEKTKIYDEQTSFCPSTHRIEQQRVSIASLVVAGRADEPSRNARESRLGLIGDDPGSFAPIRVEL